MRASPFQGSRPCLHTSSSLCVADPCFRPAGAGVDQPGASAPGREPRDSRAPKGRQIRSFSGLVSESVSDGPSGLGWGEGARFPGLTPRAGQLSPLQGEDDPATHRDLAEVRGWAHALGSESPPPYGLKAGTPPADENVLDALTREVSEDRFGLYVPWWRFGASRPTPSWRSYVRCARRRVRSIVSSEGAIGDHSQYS